MCGRIADMLSQRHPLARIMPTPGSIRDRRVSRGKSSVAEIIASLSIGTDCAKIGWAQTKSVAKKANASLLGIVLAQATSSVASFMISHSFLDPDARALTRARQDLCCCIQTSPHFVLGAVEACRLRRTSAYAGQVRMVKRDASCFICKLLGEHSAPGVTPHSTLLN